MLTLLGLMMPVSGADAWKNIEYAVNNVTNPTTATIVINVSGDTYTLNSNDIYIGRDFIDLTIQGAGAQYTIVQAETSKNVAGDRVFHVAWNNTVALKDMTIRYGQHSSGAAGIYNEGSLTLTNCTISDNVTNDKGGGIYSIYGGLTMTNCTVNGNSSAYDGAGIYSYGEILIMTNCTIAETQILIADMVALDFVAGAVL